MKIEFIPTPEEKAQFDEIVSKMLELVKEKGLFGHIVFTLESGRKILFRLDHSKTKGINNSYEFKSIEPYNA